MRFLTLTLAMAAVAQGPSDWYEPQQAKADQGKAGNSPPPALPAISAQMQKHIAAKEVAGAVTLVATPDGIVHLDATGNAGLSPAEPMRTDTIC